MAALEGTTTPHNLAFLGPGNDVSVHLAAVLAGTDVDIAGIFLVHCSGREQRATQGQWLDNGVRSY